MTVMEGTYSVFVRDLESRTLCLSVLGTDCLQDLKELIKVMQSCNRSTRQGKGFSLTKLKNSIARPTSNNFAGSKRLALRGAVPYEQTESGRSSMPLGARNHGKYNPASVRKIEVSRSVPVFLLNFIMHDVEHVD